MYHIINPPDPDCIKCRGTGEVWTMPSDPHSSMFNGVTSCDCRKYENIKKIQDRCEHKYVCKKCGSHKE